MCFIAEMVPETHFSIEQPATFIVVGNKPVHTPPPPPDLLHPLFLHVDHPVNPDDFNNMCLDTAVFTI